MGFRVTANDWRRDVPTFQDHLIYLGQAVGWNWAVEEGEEARSWPHAKGESPLPIFRFGTVFHMARHCTRQGCVHPATVSLSYQYARSLVWLDDLTPERDPHCYDLCETHASRITPPSGWHLEDRRRRVHVYGAGRLAG
jgi:hypothetical protein